MISVETNEDVFERLHKQAEERAARRRSSRNRRRKGDSFSKTGAQQSTISKSPKGVRAFSVSSDERNPNAFEIFINKPDKTNVFDRLHTTAKERTEGKDLDFPVSSVPSISSTAKRSVIYEPYVK